MIITIDGPAGTGKTTVAKTVAERLGFLYFDTGAMYRALTYTLLKRKIPIDDPDQIQQTLNSFHFDIRKIENRIFYFVDDEDVTENIRSEEVTKNVSLVAALKIVRDYLIVVQRVFGKKGRAVVEGRDIGTVVFPEAEVKIFLTARPAVRAERRYLELKEKQKTVQSQEEVMHQLMQRDDLDSNRTIAPLKQAGDAFLIDTSDLSIGEVVDLICSLSEKVAKKKKKS